MATWRTVVVSLLLAQAISGTPLINKLPPGAKWPERNSVKPPSFVAGPNGTITEALESPVEEVPKNADDVSETDPEDSESAIAEDSEEEVLNPKAIILSKDAQIDYSGAQVWKISTQKQGVRAVMGRLIRRKLISPWGGNDSFADILVKPANIQNVTIVMKREKIPYEIVIDDLQSRILEENPPLSLLETELQDRRGHRMTWKRYHRLEDIYGFLDYLAKTYPTLISVENIGKSYLGQDIKALRLSNGKAGNKKVFIDGGIHAREWISPATVTYFINQFAENFDVESEDIQSIDWYFVPVINPDGYEFTHTTDRLWRKNMRPTGAARRCKGVDLNRNWGYQWGGKGSSSNPCLETFRGSRAFSEPETKAVSEYIKKNGKFTSYLSYHSYGQYILYPWGYDNVLPQDHDALDTVGAKMAKMIQQTGGSRYSVGSSSNLLYPAAGGSDDWAHAQGIKYSYTIELSDTGRYGFVLPATYIEPVARESLAGLRVLAEAVHKA